MKNIKEISLLTDIMSMDKRIKHLANKHHVTKSSRVRSYTQYKKLSLIQEKLITQLYEMNSLLEKLI